ncbi:hypothetical protein Zmor_012478 [Zophobas morio]|uniref:Laminin subunit alpha-1 n=1 Tax=Zophobas morio TaxID=2755281 RepID=A0AA38MES5_9CUCU|nr:hypothetical protein Zmor_012478 [Zophobas morio]
MNSGLWPSSFNLATKAIISANATCGENGREEFCRMMEGGKGRCGICDNFSTDPSKKHPITYAIDGSNKWWQSPAIYYGAEYEYVTITIDLKQVYQITDVIIKSANSLRPGTWILERSTNGNDFEMWQYFARSDKECFDRFSLPGIKGKPHYFTDSEVICTSFYSKLTPMENGEIHTSLINGRPGANETSPELLEFTKARYVQFRLMGLRGNSEPLPRWFSQDILKEKRLFYTIRDISIIGYCVCNGHAESCRHNVGSGHPECECSHHTCGSNCDKCCPMHNQRLWGPGSSRDAHQCLPCNCHGHAISCHYDEDVDKAGLSMDINGNYQGGGVCDNCTAFTTGINCEKCLMGYYRPHETDIHAVRPCIKCNCDTPGSFGTCIQEGLFAGTCECLQGYEGRKCEYCAGGFKGWPKCELCPCDVKGTLNILTCDDECKCKINVNGKFCDRCKPGYFALNAESLKGCTECYCSGVTNLCESALVTPKMVQTLDNWLITDSKISSVAKPLWDNKGLFSIGTYELPFTETLYWLAPKAYLGNKLEYYGSLLTFKVHWVIMRGDTSGKPTTGPNVIIIGADGRKIAIGNDFYSTSNETFNVKLKENGWYHLPSHSQNSFANIQDNPVDRKHFLSVMSNISCVLLRATFHTDQIESLLEEVTLHADDEDSSADVEKCFCPSGYSGLSCESCAFGYVRITTNTTTRESYCGKCDCNGHSESCNPDTGECFCQHNTMGENCERCKPGYYGNPLKGRPDDCKKCECPLEKEENNFSPSCQLDFLSEGTEQEGGYVCTQCPKGYTGDHCEICDDGYFGNPTKVGSVCSPCNCNGGPCDKMTGQCLKCKGNTEGWRCEKCKVGYYGNALMSNCMSCQCDLVGATSVACDMESGQCDCKKYFTGRTCNQCESGYGNVTALCVPCACNATGSKSKLCDQHTGLCHCKTGVDGFHCDTCQNLHYGFSAAGCKECNCDKQGSKIQACDQNTGKCICKPHYEGAKCDRCEVGYYKLKSVCAPCNCNSNGSTSRNCDAETGACHCKLGVTGQKCDSCQEKHYGNVTAGCKACDPCEKEGHICHPENGKCVCPNLSVGRKCELCVANAWGHEPGIGCKPCGCSSPGRSTSQCHNVTGRCTCKLGFEGEKCDKCSFGYYDYPNCRTCKCSVPGTLPEDCSHGVCKCSLKGCRCKLNVEGWNCDKCKKGTFGIDADHPQGCISCFCSNRSTTCSASNRAWNQIRTTNVRKIEPYECVNGRNCWILPTKFTGDLIQSYGGYLRISSNSPRSSVYLTGNNITLESVTDRGGDIKLTETYWKLKYEYRSPPVEIPRDCLQQLTRTCLMVVLQNVSKIQIESRARESNLLFSEILLDKMSTMMGIPQAKTVENCTCPEEYTSSSCQDPNKGFYRHFPNESESKYNFVDRILGVAKRCQCNSRSNDCERETGHCLNCQNFTTGPQCDSCAEGYYKDYLNNCSPCLCPSERQNFAHNCTVFGQRSKQFNCSCKVGYSGKNCNKCDDTYWGIPEDSGGSCSPCNCNPYGSETLRCEKSTGTCRCKPGFAGEKCSKCSSPREIIQDGICIPCDECTQILFYTLDDLSESLKNTLDLFKDGLGPPWAFLNATVSRYDLLNDNFNDVQKAQNFIQKANISGIEGRIRIMKDGLLQQNKNLNMQTQLIDKLQSEALNNSNVVKNLENAVDDLIQNIDKFGKSQIDVNEALHEANELLNDIISIANETKTTHSYQNFFDKCQRFNADVNVIYKGGPDSAKIKTKIGDLKTKIAQLNDELKRIDSTNSLTKMKNKKNSQQIEILRHKIIKLDTTEEIIRENLTDLLSRISATNAVLKDANKIHNLLSEVDLENVAMDLDKNDLDEVYGTLSTVREHVRDLQNKIKTYKDIFNFTPDEWTKIDASSAYDTIVKGVERARKEAERAGNITLQALHELYPSDQDSLLVQTDLAKAFSDRIQKRVINLENLTEDFKNSSDQLENLKHNILMNGKSNNDLNLYLRNILRNINEHSKKITELKKAEDNARNISSVIMSIENRLRDLNITFQYDLNKTFVNYLQLLSGSEVKNLKARINETRRELDILDTSSFTRLDNVTNLNKNSTKELHVQIKQLSNVIQYANERVEGIEYGVNITKCQRFYKLNDDILRYLEISFKCDSCLLFYLKNSDHEELKIRYKNNSIVVEWKNQEVHVAANNTISLTKVASKIRIVGEETKEITTDRPFRIDSKYPLQVGNLNETSKEACLRKIKINGQTIGLWKFHPVTGTQDNCSGCYRTTANNDGLVDVFFNGNGYREVLEKDLDFSKLSRTELTFKISFASFDENSLLFLAQDRQNSCSFVALNLKNGFLELSVRHVNGDNITLRSFQKHNTGTDTKVDISLIYDSDANRQTYSLNVLIPKEPGKKEKTNRLTRENVYKIRKSAIFVGGISSITNASCVPINTTSFLGNLKVAESNNKLEVKSQNTLSAGVEPRHEKLEFDKTWFPGNGHVNLKFNADEQEMGFTIKPVNIHNNFVMNVNDILDVYLQNSNLFFRQNGKVVNFTSIHPNAHNFIYFNKTSVTVNGVYKDWSISNILREENSVYLGDHSTNKNYSSFIGNIGDIFVGDRPILFNTANVQSFQNVEIGRDRTLARNESIREMQNTERYFTPDYRTEPFAFKFGDKPNSFVLIKNPAVGKRLILEFQFRTFYPNGVLFVSNSHFKNLTYYAILEIQGGDIKLQVQGHKTKVMKTNVKINDGMWHYVQVEQILGKKKWRLVVKVDKKWKLKERLLRNSFNGELYFGGVAHVLPVHKKLKNELHPFRGCIRSLKINKNAQVVKNNNNVVYSNIGQCFQNVEEGAYFGGDAFAIYKYTFKVNKFLELSFEFKTGEPNGILLSVSNLGNSPALSVELQNGAVVMTIDMGNGIISQVTNSPHSDSSLADNEWHNITALYSSSELTVNVDGVRKSWVQSDITSMVDAIEAPLYVGGLPSNAPSGTLKIKENFKGCIRKFKIEDSIMDWTDMKKLNNVQLNSCLA